MSILDPWVSTVGGGELAPSARALNSMALRCTLVPLLLLALATAAGKVEAQASATPQPALPAATAPAPGEASRDGSASPDEAASDAVDRDIRGGAPQPDRDEQAEGGDAEVDLEIRGGAPGPVLYGEPVRRVRTSNIDRWQVVDQQRLMLYTSPSRAYLVTLRGKAPRLRFDPVIVLKLRERMLDARLDAIYIDGFPYPISRIEKLTRDVADQILGRPSRDRDDDVVDS